MNRYHNIKTLDLIKVSLSVLLVAVLASTTTFSPSSAAALPTGNLLPNPGFERWASSLPTNWSLYSNTTKLTQTSPARTGSYTVKVGSTAKTATAAGVNDGATPTVPSTIIGVSYTASCWAKASKAMTVNVQLRELNSSGTLVGSAATPLSITNTANWYQISVKYTAKASANKLPLSIYSSNTYNGGPTFLLDDCSLTQADITAPNKPVGLVASNLTSTSVNLRWTASTDNVGTLGYWVQRNGTVIATPATTTFSDTGLTPGVKYSYTLVAVDMAGNTSTASSAVSVTTPFIAPAAPTALTATAPSYNQVNLAWTAATPGTGQITSYQITRGNALLATVGGGVTNYTDIAVSPNTAYTYSVKALDSNGLASPASTAATVTTPALVAPTAPGNVRAETPSTTEVDLAWTASTPGTGSLTGYQITRNGTLLTTVDPTVTSYNDISASPGTAYTYIITAVDSLSLTSSSQPVTKNTPYTLDDWNTAMAKVIHSDVTQSTTLPDGRILWTFGDTTMVNGVSTVSGYGYPHSALATQDPGTLNFTPVKATYGYGWQPVPNWSDGTYFWMGTPVVDNGTLYVMGTRITSSGSDYSVVGVYMASFNAQTLAFQSMIELPRGNVGTVWNGITKTPNGWWLTGTHKVDCYLIKCFAGDSAFVPFNSLANTSTWQVTENIIPSSTNIGDTLYPVYKGSDQWDVYTKIGGGYFGNTIGKLSASSLTGTWTQTGTWTTTNPSGTLTYGPAVHQEQASPLGQVLLSYNVNGGPDSNYRATFVYLP